MPLYEYRCDECGHTETVTLAIKNTHASAQGDRLDVLCDGPNRPHCMGTLRRVWSANVTTATVPGFHAHDAR
jgi:predicted nucleic acid-binding Zn ribbon protein